MMRTKHEHFLSLYRSFVRFLFKVCHCGVFAVVHGAGLWEYFYP